MAWHCPYAVRQNSVDFLICKLQMKDGANYSTPAEAAKAFCACQHICPVSRRAENTESARKCCEYHRSKGV